jgi:anti-sigma factor RsiW
MTCSPFDLKDYFLRELPDPQQRQVEAHVKLCQPCREELDRLRATEAALLCVRDEEIPQRIAFVSDKIFEPSPWRRWWVAFWGSAARLGFASAAMLSAAIVIYALHPAGQVGGPVAAITHVPGPTPQIVQPVSDAEIQSRIDAAVTKAVAQVESREAEKTKSLIADLHSSLVLADSMWEQDNKRRGVLRAQNTNFGGPNEEGK